MDELVVGDAGLPQRMPWEDWSDLDLIADKTSQWVRATSPSGDADYVGRVAWSGELGFGVKAPELGQAAAALPTEATTPAADPGPDHADAHAGARKSDVAGKSLTVRVDLGECRRHKKK